MRNRIYVLFLLNLLMLFALTACTDYEELLEDDYGYLLIGTEEDWEEESSSSISDLLSSSATTEDSESSSSIADAVCYGEYGANYTCVTTKYLNQGMLVANGYGEFVDTRDDQVYKTVTIGTQTWMAQNLNYNYNKGTAKSYCYDDDPDNCDTYGRLYTWAAAIDSVALANDADDPKTCGYGKTCTLPTVVQGVCPNGWHLPSYDEWETLFSYVGNEVGSSYVGTALKTASGWYSQTGDVADRDAYGFSALPAGSRDVNGYFYNAGNNAFFWSSSEYGSYFPYFMGLHYSIEYALLDSSHKFRAFSVRCLQNSN